MSNWEINISTPSPGLAPAHWIDTYHGYGNKNMFSSMTDVDISNPNTITQGPAPTALTNGTHAGAVTTLIKGIYAFPKSASITYGVGGNKLYRFSNTSVENVGIWPHTINHPTETSEDGESVIVAGTDVFYFYNHNSRGDIGKYDGSSTFDDDWGSTVPINATTLQNAPHPITSVGQENERIYFGNGQYLGYIDTTGSGTLFPEQIDFGGSSVVVDLVFESNLVWVAVNNPNLEGGSQNRGFITVWDGASPSYQEPVIEVNGQIGALFTLNGVIYCMYKENSQGVNRLAFVNGNSIQDITQASFTGTLPKYYQVSIFDNQIMMFSDGKVYQYGSSDKSIKQAFSYYCTSTYTTGGGISNAFGSLLTASHDGSTNYNLDNFGGYSTNAEGYTVWYNVRSGMVNSIEILYSPTAPGAQVDLSIERDFGKRSAISVGSISHTDDSGDIRKTVTDLDFECNTLRLKLDWSNGSATNPLEIRDIVINGNTVESLS